MFQPKAEKVKQHLTKDIAEQDDKIKEDEELKSELDEPEEDEDMETEDDEESESMGEQKSEKPIKKDTWVSTSDGQMMSEPKKSANVDKEHKDAIKTLTKSKVTPAQIAAHKKAIETLASHVK